MKNIEVIVIVPAVIVQALQLDDGSVREHYRIKHLASNCGNQYLFGIHGLAETLMDAEDRAGYSDDSLLSPEEFDIWAGLVIDGMKLIREHGRKALNDLDAVDQRFL